MIEGLRRLTTILGTIALGLVAVSFALLILYIATGIFYRLWWYALRRPFGKKALLVYSHSPKWQDHIESDWLPRLKDKVVILNTSLKTQADIFDRGIFHYFAGYKDHTPCAIVFESLWRVRVIRFFKAFQKAKHGRLTQLIDLEEGLFSVLGEERPSSLRAMPLKRLS